MVDTVTQPPEGKKTEDLSPAEFWAQLASVVDPKTGKPAYDHKIFEKDLDVDDLRKSDSWKYASALVYEMKEGKSWAAHCEDEGMDPKSAEAEEALGEYGVDSARWIQNNLAKTSAALWRLKNASTNEQKLATLYLIQSYDQSGMSLSGVAQGFYQGAVDPLNLASIAVGSVTLGTGTAALQASAQATRVGLKTFLATAAKDILTKEVGKSLGKWAGAGAVDGATRDALKQNLTMQEVKINGKDTALQSEYHAGQTFKAAGTSALITTGFSVAGKFIGATKGYAFQTHSAGEAAGQIIPAPYETWAHKLLKFDPFQRANERGFQNLTDNQGVNSFGWRNIPTRYLSQPTIETIVRHVDDKIRDADIIQPIFNLDRNLVKLRKLMASSGDPATQDRISDIVHRQLTRFSDAHRGKFAQLKTSLDALSQELDNYEVVGIGEGKVGLDDGQLPNIKQYVAHIKILCDEVQNPATLINKFDQNRALFDKDIGITGAFQHYINLAGGADLRLKYRDKLSWDPSAMGWLDSGLKEAQKRLTKLQKMETNGLLNNAQQQELKSLQVYSRAIEDGKDGVKFGGKYNRLRPIPENINQLRWQLNEGVFVKDTVRTAEVIDGTSSFNNIENFAINLARGQKGTEGDLVSVFINAYKAGGMGEIAMAMRRLKDGQGRSGGVANFPINIGEFKKLLGQAVTGDSSLENDHFQKNFLPSIYKIADAIGQSPELFGDRDMAKKFKDWSQKWFDARVSPSERIVGTPGKNYYIKDPVSYFSKQVSALIIGGRVVPKTDDAGKIVDGQFKIDWQWNKAAPDGAGALATKWHNLTDKNPIERLIFTPITLPLRATREVFNNAVKPAFGHTWTGFLLFGAGALGVEKLAESATGEDKPDVAAAIWSFPIKTAATVLDTTLNTTAQIYPTATSLLPWLVGKPSWNLSPAQVLVNNYVHLPWSDRYDRALVGLKVAGFTPFSDKLDKLTHKDAGFGMPDMIAFGGTKGGESDPISFGIETRDTAGATAGLSTVASSGQPTSPDQPVKPEEVTVAVDKLPAELRKLAKDTIDLHNAVVDAKGWENTKITVEAGKPPVDAKDRLKELVALRTGLAKQISESGEYAKAIDTHTGDILSMLATPLPPTDKHDRIEDWETPKLEKVDTRVRTWHDKLANLNQIVVNNHGWSEENKKEFKTLQDEEKSFHQDALFLKDDATKNGYAEALKYMAVMEASSKITGDSKLRPWGALALAPTTVVTPPPAGTVSGKGGDPAAGTVETEEQKTERLKKEKIEKEKTAKKNKENEANGSGSSSGSGSDSTEDKNDTGNSNTHTVNNKGEDVDWAESGGKLVDSVKDALSLDGNDSVTQVVNNSLSFMGSSVKAGGGWLKNTYNRLMSKPDGSGRALIRDGGAAIGAIAFMSTIGSSTLDRLGIGNIPFIGSFLKIGALVLSFMAIRKGADSFMDKPQSVSQGADREIIRPYSDDPNGNPVTKSQVTKEIEANLNGTSTPPTGIHTASLTTGHNGGGLRYANLQSIGPDARQSASNDANYADPNVAGDSVSQNPVSNVTPIDFRNKARPVEAVLHGQLGGEATYLDVDPKTNSVTRKPLSLNTAQYGAVPDQSLS